MLAGFVTSKKVGSKPTYLDVMYVYLYGNYGIIQVYLIQVHLYRVNSA